MDPQEPAPPLPPAPLVLIFREMMKFSPHEEHDMLQVVDDWIQLYRHRQPAARAQLFNFILEACGLQYPINDKVLGWIYPLREKFLATRLHIEDVRCDMRKLVEMETVTNCETLQLDFPNIKELLGSFCHTLIQRSRDESFFLDILKDCKDSMITLSCYLPVGYNKMVIWMTFHTIQSLVEALVDLNSEAQWNNAEYLEELERKTYHFEQNTLEFYQGFFLRFYKDDDQEIRTACQWELNSWRALYPSLFSSQAYLDDLQAGKDVNHT